MNKMNRRKRYYSLSSFVSFFKLYKWRFVFVTLAFLIADLFLAIIPLFIGKLVGALGAHSIDQHAALMYLWLLIGCSIGHDLSWRVSELLHMKFMNALPYEYETMLFKQVIGKPYPYFVDKFTGKVASYINTITQELRGLIENITYNYTSQVVGLVTVTIILTSINWQTGAIFIVGLIAMIITGRYTIRNSSGYEKKSADVQSTKNAKVIDAIANFVNVKSFRKEHTELALMQHEQVKTVEASNKSFFWGLVFWGSMSLFVREFIWPLTIGLNVYLFLHGQISLTQLATLLSTILIFSSTIWEIIWQISQFNLKLARIEEAHLYLFGKANIIHDHFAKPAAIKAQKPEFSHSLELKDVQFAYPEKQDTAVLKNISLTLKKGEKVGIVGKSGSGKTTLTKLLLDYYPLETGELCIDGRAVTADELVTIISYVPQDTSLFHRTIAENIAYAAEQQVTQHEIETAAKLAHAHEFIAKINEGYKSLVGERGVKLSAGQRQRIAIARAFLDDKPILILDEATSALDSESEVLVQQALENLWHNKTVIAIAHRLSTLRNMDRILVMDKGQIIEQGSHEELLKAKGTYAKLWNHQSGGFIEE